MSSPEQATDWVCLSCRQALLHYLMPILQEHLICILAASQSICISGLL